MQKTLQSYKPAVRRHWLVLASGVVWLAVGIGLIGVACFWLYGLTWPLSLILGALSLVMGLIVYLFGFSRIVKKKP